MLCRQRCVVVGFKPHQSRALYVSALPQRWLARDSFPAFGEAKVASAFRRPGCRHNKADRRSALLTTVDSAAEQRRCRLTVNCGHPLDKPWRIRYNAKEKSDTPRVPFSAREEYLTKVRRLCSHPITNHRARSPRFGKEEDANGSIFAHTGFFTHCIRNRIHIGSKKITALVRLT